MTQRVSDERVKALSHSPNEMERMLASDLRDERQARRAAEAEVERLKHYVEQTDQEVDDMRRQRETADWRAETAKAEVKRLKHDAVRGQELETVICMHTHFTGEPPYVGTEGLKLAVVECISRAEAAEAKLAQYEAVVQAARGLSFGIDRQKLLDALAKLKERTDGT